MNHPPTERTVLDPNIRLYAYKVPGGWLYVKDDSMEFVPDAPKPKAYAVGYWGTK